MSGYAGARVGALGLRAVHHNATRQASVGQFQRNTVSQTLPLLASRATSRCVAPNLRANSTSPPSISTFARSFSAGSSLASQSRPHAAKQSPVQLSVTFVVASTWARHASRRVPNSVKKQFDSPRRYKSSSSKDDPPPKPPPSAPQAELSPQPKAPPNPHESPSKRGHESSPDKPKHVFGRLPNALPHLYRPSKQELLDAASGFFSRLRVHFKWFTIRSTRPFTADEIYALFTWILAAHVFWLVLGTTTFISALIWAVNSIFAQETLAKWAGNYLTKSTGLQVVFEKALAPKWNTIEFDRVHVSRRPGKTNAFVRKGSAADAAATIGLGEKDEAENEVKEDTNYTQFEVTIEKVGITLSFWKWWNGTGLLETAEIKGVRGVVDRTHVVSLPDVDPRSYKHKPQPGDFELESFKMEDVLVTIYQPGNFRPFPVSIFQCDLPRLRKQWISYDFMSANHMSGSFDNSLFNIHPRQTHNFTGSQLAEGRDTEQGTSWKKQSRIRIDGLNIDHLNRGMEGPFSWIYEGNVDIVADVGIPSENEDSVAKVMSDIYDRVEATVTQNGQHKQHYSDHAAHGFDTGDHNDEQKELGKHGEQDERWVVMDVRVHLNDVRATVPVFTKDLSYVNNALIRPIVAYINSQKTFIPVHCRVSKPVSHFDGSWTIYDSGLMDDLSQEMYDAFARDVLNDNTARKRRIKKVGIWTLQLAAQALFLGLAGNIA